MTAPVLAHKKFWIVKPRASINQIKNPTFASPDYEEDWAASGSGVTIEETSTEQRRGAYSMKVNTATGVASGAYHGGLSVTDPLPYTFSCDVKGVAGQAMRIYIANSSGTAKATTTFTATGYWQRVEVTYKAAESVATYRAYVIRDAVASTAAFYVDGAQFEQQSKATTFFDGYTPGCRWTGAIRNSSSYRSPNTGLGGELVDLSDYCEIVSVSGLGHGDWNQILTKMTSGGDMYQTHIRKSRQFSIVVDFIGDTLGEIETNRKAVIDAIRPDLLSNLPVNEQFGINWGADYRGHEQRIIRYQGVDVNGYEATNPVDIVCVPLPATLTDTPDIPSHQRAVLNFTIPSGLLDGAYNDGAQLDWVADFPAEFIVKRDANGNWCTVNGANHDSLITGLNGAVYCMAEAPDGKIYAGGAFTNAGGVGAADYIARWNPVAEKWEAVGAPAFTDPGGGITVKALTFDAGGNLLIVGAFLNAGGVSAADYFAKFDGTNWTALGSGIDAQVNAVAVDENGIIYIGGAFTTAGGNTNCNGIAYYDTLTSNWKPLSTGLNSTVLTLGISYGGVLYIGGAFTDTSYPYLCYWDGSAFQMVGEVAMTGEVYTIKFDDMGKLIAGGSFMNAGNIPDADYIARWNGTSWEALGTGTNGSIRSIEVSNNKYLVGGLFSTAGGLSLTDRVAVWSNGAWQPLDIDLPGTATVLSVLPASDGSLYIGGSFSTAGTAGTPNAECGIVSDRVFTIGVASASANTYPFISVYGPGTLQAITNYTTGKSVMFDGLTLQAGEWIGLNFDPLHLKFQGGWTGRGNLMRYVIPGSDYGDFYLKPGSNALSLFMTGTTSASGALIYWTPQFWGLDGALL